MCKYCDENNFELLTPQILKGRNMSETEGGDICIEKTNGFYYISADCFENHHTESETISYCPMCGRNL